MTPPESPRETHNNTDNVMAVDINHVEHKQRDQGRSGHNTCLLVWIYYMFSRIEALRSRSLSLSDAAKYQEWTKRLRTLNSKDKEYLYGRLFRAS